MIIDHITFIGCYSEKECEDVQRPTSSCEGTCVHVVYYTVIDGWGNMVDIPSACVWRGLINIRRYIDLVRHLEVHTTLLACLFLLQFPSSLSSVLSLFDFDPEEIARQLTIIDFRLFAKIKPAELLNQVRSCTVWRKLWQFCVTGWKYFSINFVSLFRKRISDQQMFQ